MKSRKSSQRKRRPRPEDRHLAFGQIVDPVALKQSVATDAIADREWLAANPDVVERVRPASLAERQACGAPLGTTVLVRRGPAGSQIRVLLAPDVSRN